jgi:hypothetical protein
MNKIKNYIQLKRSPEFKIYTHISNLTLHKITVIQLYLHKNITGLYDI